ncbi:hypothetical protein K431DRAFT_283306, partial [Polychaeton citri CBS 116435]
MAPLVMLACAAIKIADHPVASAAADPHSAAVAEAAPWRSPEFCGAPGASCAEREVEPMPEPAANPAPALIAEAAPKGSLGFCGAP